MEQFQSPDIAKRNWVLKNNITTTLDPNSQNDNSCQISQQEKPWINDPLYFNTAKISDLALLRMVMHASSAPSIETVGLLLGKIDGDAFVVMDVFALPVEASEIGFDAKTKLLEYYETQAQAGGLENVVGWYRSDPGYGPYVTPTDVSTQMRIQQFKETSMAVLIEPYSTVTFGETIIKALRTYPEDYTPPDRPFSFFKTKVPDEILKRDILLKKRHPLNITYFKSLLDSNLFEDLWNKYWAHIISVKTSSHKKVDPKVSENKGAPIVYFIYVSNKVSERYSSSDEVLEAVFVKLVEEVGSSRSQIKTYMRSFFFATLTEEQAKKMSGKGCVRKVRPQLPY